MAIKALSDLWDWYTMAGFRIEGDIRPQFLDAVSAQNLNHAKICLQLGVDVNCQRDEDGFTALHIAISNQHYNMASLILEQSGVNVNIKNRHGYCALHLCIIENCLDIAALVLERRADPNILDRFGNTPLHFAVRIRSLSFAQLLLKYKPDVNVFNCMEHTPLHRAVLESPYLPMVDLLINNGAETEHNVGYLPLFLEAILSYATNEDLEIIMRLINEGIDVNVTDKFTKRNALHIIAMSRHHALALKLLQYGVDYEHMDSRGRIPLDVAREHRQECMVFLLENCHYVLTLVRHRPSMFL